MMRILRALARNPVPILFLVVTATGIIAAGLNVSRVSTDVMERFFRSLFLVLSLLIPIVAGLGLNFGIVLGAMAGQIGLMTVQDRGLEKLMGTSFVGIEGVAIAVICSIPIAMLLGYLTGLLFNRTRGREMITGIILGFFANGIYQLFFLILAGPVIPITAKDMLLPQGMGVRVTVNLTTVERGLTSPLDFVEEESWLYPVRELGDSVGESLFGRPFRGAIPIRIGGEYFGEVPVITLLLNVFLCLGIFALFRTKLGQDLRAVGQDPHVAEVAGIPVNRCRIIAIILSMVLAGIGQIIWLQNMSVMNTFQAHEQVGFYAIAALLVGGATVTRATIGNAVLGTFLFHALIVVVALAGQELMNSPQIGEYLREFFLYAIIGASLAIHAWRHRRTRETEASR